MRRRHLLAGAAALAGAGTIPLTATPATAAAPPPAVLPSRADIVATLRRVNDFWIGGHANPGDNKWARATYFSGDMALYKLTGEPRYLAYATRWAEQSNYGINGGLSTRHADNHNAGQVYYDLHDAAPDPAKVANINESLRRMLVNQPTKNDDWWWVDALHMAMPAFVRVARFRNDSRYLTKLFSLYRHTRDLQGGGLYDTRQRRWYRDDRFNPGGENRKSPNGKPIFWSRGNGWAAAAFAKVLGLIPATDAHVADYRSALVSLSGALRTIQRADGFWNVNLGDPQHLPGPETSGTAMFCFAMGYGVRTGLLDRATYLPVVAKAWNGMVQTAVHTDGFLGYVQGVGSEPASSQPVTFDTTADFGVGAFLLAGTAAAKLTQ
jgi:unsaturated rhamnogalacturonyl hydrolase